MLFSMDMTTGNTKLFENGKKSFEVTSEALVEYSKKIKSTMNHVSAGCLYRKTGIGFMFMYGKITDLQMIEFLIPEDWKL